MDRVNATVFLTVIETGSYRKAADALGYTQAGISYIINSMEEQTGLSLFLRERDGVRLSREGEILLPLIKQLDHWERRFRQTVDELNGLEKGTVRVRSLTASRFTGFREYCGNSGMIFRIFKSS